MIKNRMLEKLMRFLLTLLGAGVGLGAALWYATGGRGARSIGRRLRAAFRIGQKNDK